MESAGKMFEIHPWRGCLPRTPSVTSELFRDQFELLLKKRLESQHELKCVDWYLKNYHSGLKFECTLPVCYCKPKKVKKKYPNKSLF